MDLLEGSALLSSLLFSSSLLPFISSTPHVELCLPANTVRFTPREVAEEEEQQAEALFKHGTYGCTAAHLCGNIGEMLAWVKTENEDESKALGSLFTLCPINLMFAQIWTPQHIKMADMTVNKVLLYDPEYS